MGCLLTQLTYTTWASSEPGADFRRLLQPRSVRMTEEMVIHPIKYAASPYANKRFTAPTDAIDGYHVGYKVHAMP